MRRSNLHVPAVGCAMIVLGVSAGGCSTPHEDCSLTFECPSTSETALRPPSPPPPPDPECIPGESGWSPPENCGIFLSQSLGDDANKGTKGTPVASFARAIALAQGDGGTRRIYACAEPFEESVSVPPGVTIYGGLACASGWAHGPGVRTTLKSKPGAMKLEAIPLRLGGDTYSPDEIRIEGLDVTAPEGENGGSSVAVIVSRVHANLARCTFQADNGSDGIKGARHDIESGVKGYDGSSGGDACSSDDVLGGKQLITKCDMGYQSSGGAGGTGSEYSGSSGAKGESSDESLTKENGGAGEKGSICKNGTKGDDGTSGMPGLGGRGVGELQQLVDKGTIGVKGSSGEAGLPGQGGGGGGGAKGVFGTNKCASGTGKGGASGGGGGTGGCGGLGGTGGAAGGSSIALVSFEATLTFQDVTLFARNGGKGGDGSDGQLGGEGGLGGVRGNGKDGLNNACYGGPGGVGGAGGKGGGGVGGHSFGIAYKGERPLEDGLRITIGIPGSGGIGDGAEGTGETGLAATVHSFLN